MTPYSIIFLTHQRRRFNAPPVADFTRQLLTQLGEMDRFPLTRPLLNVLTWGVDFIPGGEIDPETGLICPRGGWKIVCITEWTDPTGTLNVPPPDDDRDVAGHCRVHPAMCCLPGR